MIERLDVIGSAIFLARLSFWSTPSGGILKKKIQLRLLESFFFHQEMPKAKAKESELSP